MYWALVMIQQGCVGVLGPSHDTAGVYLAMLSCGISQHSLGAEPQGALHDTLAQGQ